MILPTRSFVHRIMSKGEIIKAEDTKLPIVTLVASDLVIFKSSEGVPT